VKKQSFLESSAILILSAVTAKLMGAVFRIPLANMLGGEGMGYFSSAYGIFMTVYAVSVTGLPAAVAKLTAENSALERFANVRRVKRSALLFFSATGLAFTLLMIAAAYPFCALTGGVKTLPSLLAIAPSILFGCVTSVYRGYYEGLRNMVPTALSQIAEGLAKLAAGLALCLWVLKNPEKALELCAALKLPSDSVLSAAAAAAVLGITLSTAAGTLFLVLRDKLGGDGITPEQLSSTSGAGCTDSAGSIIAALLKTAGWEITNAGENGRCIPRQDQETGMLVEMVRRAKADMVVIMLGSNDLLQDPGLSAAACGAERGAACADGGGFTCADGAGSGCAARAGAP